MQEDGLCDGFVKITIETGPEFKVTETVVRALDQIEASFAEIAAEVEGDVAGFGFEDPLGIRMAVHADSGGWAEALRVGRQISNKYGCHCVAKGQTVNNQ